MAVADASIQVEVFVDLVCPWCYLGKRRLDAAVERFGGPVDVRYRAFQLQPGLPPEGMPSDEYFAQRFGSPATVESMHARVRAEGEHDGIAFAFDSMERFPNTYLAHRALALAAGASAQAAAAEALFSAYFERGVDIGDLDAVTASVAAAGAPVDRDDLASGGGSESVDADLAVARELGINGVPFFIADSRFAISGAVPPEHLAKLLAHAREQRRPAA
jgi:predicted DsbA family dithiol-disulfide isomerase